MAIGAMRERTGRDIVTFVHLSLWLSGAVITAAGGSLLCLGLGQRAKSAVNEKTVGEFGENGRSTEESLCAIHSLITLPPREQLELLPKLQQFFRICLDEIGSVVHQFLSIRHAYSQMPTQIHHDMIHTVIQAQKCTKVETETGNIQQQEDWSTMNNA